VATWMRMFSSMTLFRYREKTAASSPPQPDAAAKIMNSGDKRDCMWSTLLRSGRFAAKLLRVLHNFVWIETLEAPLEKASRRMYGDSVRYKKIVKNGTSQARSIAYTQTASMAASRRFRYRHTPVASVPSHRLHKRRRLSPRRIDRPAHLVGDHPVSRDRPSSPSTTRRGRRLRPGDGRTLG
jgi:hypothetical protein